MDEADFRRAADAAIEELTQELYAAEDEGGFEVEEQSGALYVIFEKPAGKFVITPNAPVQQIQFSLIDNGTIIGMYLFIPGFNETEIAWKEIGYLLLDEALGEYDVETKLGPISVLSPDSDQAGERFPLNELPEIFDRHVLTLQNRAKGFVQVRRPN